MSPSCPLDLQPRLRALYATRRHEAIDDVKGIPAVSARAADCAPAGRSCPPQRGESAQQAESEHSWPLRAVLTLALANDLWFIWSNRFIPMSDYPDWLYQGWILSRILRGAPLAHYTLNHYPVPNATLVTIVMGTLGLATSPESAGKIVLSLVLGLFVFGSVRMLRSIRSSERNPMLLIPVLLMLNSYFFWGEISFLCGIGFFFLYCGWLFRRLDNFDSIPVLAFIGWSIVLFFSHLMPYLLATAVTGCVALAGMNRRRAWRMSATILPSAAATVWYAGARVQAHNLGAGPLWIWWTPHLMAGHFLAAFSPYPEFLPSYGIRAPAMPLAAILNLLVCGLIVAVWLMCAGMWLARRRARAAIFAAASICLAGFVLAGFAFAGWVSPGERFLYPAAWLAMAWLGLQIRPREGLRLRGAAMIVLTGLIVVQCILIDSYGHAASLELERGYQQLQAAKSREAFCKLYQDYVTSEQIPQHRKGLDQFLTGHAGFIRLPYYLFIERGQAAPIFQLGIFSYDGPGNNENLCS